MKMHLPSLSSHSSTVESRVSTYSKLPSKRGFTLVEILVVLAIIGILLGVGVGAIKSLATSKGVSTAVPLAEGIFAQARQSARATGAPTRVVIYSDTSDTDVDDQNQRYLRMIGVVTGRINSDGDLALNGESVSEWKFTSRPVTLPRGAYFNESISVHSGEDTAIFPGGSRSCYVYEFNSQGTLITATNDGTGDPIEDGSFVLQAGNFVPGPQINEDNSAKRDVGGFRVYRNGRIATYLNPDQIIAGGSDPTFN